MKNTFSVLTISAFLSFFAPDQIKAQEISCEDLRKIEINASNREAITTKYQNAIYECAGITRADSIALLSIELSTVAKHGPASNNPSKTIGDLIRELQLMKTEPEYEDIKELSVFIFEHINKIIDIKDKPNAVKPLTMLASVEDENTDATQLVNYIFSPACKGLTYQEGYQKFLKLYKK
ncbi:hypothetical protein FAZ15_03120 [Sphingobacterium olei]|uniref:Uncharacterized protein n=1 Tax=Sphingobacterium olei TaxID=2571155 RepID=A0A4U0P7E2_9SPHI|nr:hypothetical protein [Sphingobacterium olei]TJZ63289.1 hypothetical protein FAZ15_03120 [Sphingobacterium olei]